MIKMDRIWFSEVAAPIQACCIGIVQDCVLLFVRQSFPTYVDSVTRFMQAVSGLRRCRGVRIVGEPILVLCRSERLGEIDIYSGRFIQFDSLLDSWNYRVVQVSRSNSRQFDRAQFQTEEVEVTDGICANIRIRREAAAGKPNRVTLGVAA
jgi:hypothetical protein